jgi:hypothetical protein
MNPAAAIEMVLHRISEEHPGHKTQTFKLVDMEGFDVWCLDCDERILTAKAYDKGVTIS